MWSIRASLGQMRHIVSVLFKAVGIKPDDTKERCEHLDEAPAKAYLEEDELFEDDHPGLSSETCKLFID